MREEGDRVVHQLAINTDSGGINSYAMLKWLEDVDYLASRPVKGNRSPADGSYHPAYRQSIGHVPFPQSLSHEKSKHIDIQYHIIRGKVENKELN